MGKQGKYVILILVILLVIVGVSLTQTKLPKYLRCLVTNWHPEEAPLQPLPVLPHAEQAKANAEKNWRNLMALRRWLDAWFAVGFDRYGPQNTSLFARDIAVETASVRNFEWNPENNAADNYPYMVLTAAFLQDAAAVAKLEGTLRDERRYAQVYDGLAGNYDILRDERFPLRPIPGYSYNDQELSLRHTSEYVRDGLLTITEALPDSPWQLEAYAIIKAMQRNSNFSTAYGMLPFDDTEGNGYALQAYVRFYYLTNDSTMLPPIRALADAYLYEAMNTSTLFPALVWDFRTHRPKSDMLKLREHGQEIIEGVILAYMLEQDLDPRSERTQRYREILTLFLSNLQRYGMNADGMIYSRINAETGVPLGKNALTDHLLVWPLNLLWKRLYPQRTLYCLGEPLENYDTGRRIVLAELTKTFGYIYNGFLMFADLTGEDRWRTPAQHALANLPKYHWEMPEMIGDSTESFFYLSHNLPDAIDMRLGLVWVERGIAKVHASQSPAGFFEGWYAGEGNVARALLFHSNFLTQGVRVVEWNANISYGASYDREQDTLHLWIKNTGTQAARIRFDYPRHRQLGLRKDYARTQMFMEWYAVAPEGEYAVQDRVTGANMRYTGAELISGIPMSVGAHALTVQRIR